MRCWRNVDSSQKKPPVTQRVTFSVQKSKITHWGFKPYFSFSFQFGVVQHLILWRGSKPHSHMVKLTFMFSKPFLSRVATAWPGLFVGGSVFKWQELKACWWMGRSASWHLRRLVLVVSFFCMHHRRWSGEDGPSATLQVWLRDHNHAVIQMVGGCSLI